MTKFILKQGETSELKPAIQIMKRREDEKVDVFSEFGISLAIFSNPYKGYRVIKGKKQIIFVLGELEEPKGEKGIIEEYGIGTRKHIFSKFKGNAVLIVIAEGAVRIVTEPWFRRLIYYTPTDDLVVSSELKGILAVNKALSKQIDQVAIHSYIAFEAVYGNRTLFEGIKVFHSGAIYERQTEKWYKIARFDYPVSYNKKMDLGDQAKLIAQRLRNLAEMYYNRGYKALFLSGGLDSRTILAAFPNQVRKGVLGVHISNPKITETKFTREVANVAGINLIEYEAKPSDILEVAYRQAWLGEGGRFFGTGVVRKIVEKVEKGPFIDGNPGDLNLGGTWANKLSRHPVSPKNKYYDKGLILGEPIGRSSINQKTIERIFGKDQAEKILMELFELIQHEIEIFDFVQDQTLQIEYYAMHNRIRRQHPEEPNETSDIFQPFLDDDICRNSFSVPIEYRTERKFQTRVINELDEKLANLPSTSIVYVNETTSLKERVIDRFKALAKKIPIISNIGRKVIYRRIARSIENNYIPLNTWLREDKEFRDFVINQLNDFEKRGFIQPGIINQMVEEHLNYENNHMITLQKLVNLELLLKMFADGKGFEKED